MTRSATLRRMAAGRDALRVFVTLLVLVGVAFGVQAQSLQAPGYLVFAGFDALQNHYLPGLGETAFWALFVGYCYLLAVLLAGTVRLGRRVSETPSPASPPPQ